MRHVASTGTAGRIENCQIGVFLGYASSRGHTLLDGELYLPKEGVADRARRHEAGVPPEIAFATKPQLARTLLERAFQAGVPHQWVTADAVYGGDRRFRRWLEEQEQAFVLAVRSTEALWCNIGRAGGKNGPARSRPRWPLPPGNGAVRGWEPKGRGSTPGCGWPWSA